MKLLKLLSKDPEIKRIFRNSSVWESIQKVDRTFRRYNLKIQIQDKARKNIKK